MSGTKDEPAGSVPNRYSHSQNRPLKATLSSSFQVLRSHPATFFSIAALAILPLAFLTFSSSISAAQPLLTQISSKLSLAKLAVISTEASHVRSEAHSDARQLVRLRALFFVPSYAFSLVAAITSISSTATSLSGRRPSRLTLLASVSRAWWRLLATSLLSSLLTCAYKNLARAVLYPVGFAQEGVVLTVVVLEAIWEMHLMAVLSVGMVVSVVEERNGLEALRAGWALMEGRRLCGVVLAGTAVLCSGGIGWGFRMLNDEEEMGGVGAVVFLAILGKVVLVGLFCLVVLWTYVTNTALYFDCKKFHGINSEKLEESNGDSCHVEIPELVEEDG